MAIKKIIYLVIISLVVTLLYAISTQAQFEVLSPDQGGTGTSTTPLDGKLLIGSGGSYLLNNLTAGSNITITNGSGTITIASTGGGSGTTTINGVAASNFTLGSSTQDTNIGITISSGTNPINFNTIWIGTLADARIASAVTWNAKQANILWPIPFASTTGAQPSFTSVPFASTTGVQPAFTSVPFASTTGVQNTITFPLDYASTTNVQKVITWPIGVASTSLGTSLPLSIVGNNLIFSGTLAYASTTGIQNTITFPISVASTSLGTSNPLSIVGNNLIFSGTLAYASTTGIQNTITFPLGYGSTTHISFPIGAASTTGLQANLGSAFVSSTSAGVGITVNQTTGALTVTNNGVLAITAGGGITRNTATGTVTITNNGVTSITAGTNITIDNATGTVTINSTASGGTTQTINNYSKDFLIENPNNTEDDALMIFDATSTINNIYAVNIGTPVTAPSVPFNLVYSSSRTTATTSAFKVFTGYATSTATTTAQLFTPTASSTPNLGDTLRFITGGASSSSQILVSVYYTTAQTNPTFSKYYLAEGINSAIDDAFMVANGAITVTKVMAVNKTNGDSVPFNILWNSSRTQSTSTSFKVFAADQTNTATTTATTYTSFASSTISAGSVIRFYTTAAATSTQFLMNMYYTQ